MHPKEYKKIKVGTGRLTHLSLLNSEIHVGTSFDDNTTVQKLIADPKYLPVLLFPGTEALNLSEKQLKQSDLGDRQLLVFILDATWILAKKMLTATKSLHSLRQIMFTPSTPSRYVIKKQPNALCLSTIEVAHELLLALESSGIDTYERPEQLLELFDRMQQYQIKRLLDPRRNGYRLWATERHKVQPPVANPAELP